MKDMQARLEMLRTQIAECERLQPAAKSNLKRTSSKGWQINTEFWPPSLSERWRNPKNPKGKAAVQRDSMAGIVPASPGTSKTTCD